MNYVVHPIISSILKVSVILSDKGTMYPLIHVILFTSGGETQARDKKKLWTQLAVHGECRFGFGT